MEDESESNEEARARVADAARRGTQLRYTLQYVLGGLLVVRADVDVLVAVRLVVQVVHGLPRDAAKLCAVSCRAHPAVPVQQKEVGVLVRVVRAVYGKVT